MICCPANQRLSSARWQLEDDVMSEKRTHTSPRLLCWSGQHFMTEPYFRHSCSTSASMSLKNSGSFCRLTCEGLNIPWSTMTVDGEVFKPIPPIPGMPGMPMPGARCIPGACGRPSPGMPGKAGDEPCSFCMRASLSLESLSSPGLWLGPSCLASWSKPSSAGPLLPRASDAEDGPASPRFMSLVAMPTFSSLPASWKPFMAVMASRASDAFLNCTNAKPLHLLVYGSRCKSMNSISPKGENNFLSSSSEMLASESVRPPTYKRSGVSRGAV
mmetsp:Transcript_102642/g.313921  ORF Transcript_102642/g.313921 Transcript_102642/m.313921 type:complete len:272 (+) Transcript_102642:87-902(+)